MEPLTPRTRIQSSPDVLFSQVEDESVLLNLRSGVYYSLDRVGTLIWSRIAAGESLGNIQAALRGQFEADSDVIWADLTSLVSDFGANGLITVLVGEER